MAALLGWQEMNSRRVCEIRFRNLENAGVVPFLRAHTPIPGGVDEDTAFPYTEKRVEVL